MVRFFQFVLLMLGLSVVALVSAIVTMSLVIHGAEVKVPKLVGLTAQEAREKSAELGMEISIDNRIYSAEVPSGRIVTQSPVAGTVVRREWHIRAIESLGPQLAAIPNLVGLQERAAQIQIRRLGLEPGAVVHLPSAAAAMGMVIAQDPQAGAAGVERPSIGLVIGDDADAQIAGNVMPDFTGQPYATVTATISHAGLKLGPTGYASVQTVANSAFPPVAGVVLSQSPQAGYRVDATTEIDLTVLR
jgi:beta-lactam-binding protein with PASTA domain